MEWLDPGDLDGQLEFYSQLGFGSYSGPVIERWFARSAFFIATRKMAPGALTDLRDTCLPAFSTAMNSNPGVWGYSYPAVTMEISERGWTTFSALVATGWGTLCWAALQHNELRELRDCFKEWWQKHNFNDPWLIDSAWTNLAGWHSQEWERDSLIWQYPSGVLIGNYFSLSGKGLEKFRYRRSLPPPLAYDPGSQSWEGYIASLDSYRTQQESLFARSGFHQRKTKRSRAGSKTAHFEWLVRYQIQARSYEEIAAEYDVEGIGLDRASVGEAIRKTAGLVGLRLREARRGRKARPA